MTTTTRLSPRSTLPITIDTTLSEEPCLHKQWTQSRWFVRCILLLALFLLIALREEWFDIFQNETILGESNEETKTTLHSTNSSNIDNEHHDDRLSTNDHGTYDSSTTEESQDWSTSKLPSSYRICHAHSPQQNYVCQGNHYEQFANSLEDLVVNLSNSTKKSKYWGQRPFPFPSNTTILAIGNSHTRQVMTQIPCQYSSVVKRIVDVENDNDNDNVSDIRKGSIYRIEFTNHVNLYIVTNHVLFYSPQWSYLLQDILQNSNKDEQQHYQQQQPIQFDAIIYGKMNTIADSKNTNFLTQMMERQEELRQDYYQEKEENIIIDFETISPPTLVDAYRELSVSKRNGTIHEIPIVAHSMLGEWKYDILPNYHYMELREQWETVMSSSKHEHEYEHEHGQSLSSPLAAPHVALINGRSYVPALGECGSDQYWTVGPCTDSIGSHRCIGHRGGHPDLIAWDIIEAVYSFLVEEK